jgi:hypothetical protein
MKTHLLKTITNSKANYQIVEQNHQLPKDTKYFIKYRPCIYKGVECAIIETSINNVLIVFENKEIRVNHQAITTHHQH